MRASGCCSPEEPDLCDRGVLIPANFENEQDQPLFRQLTRHHVVYAHCSCSDDEMRLAENVAETFSKQPMRTHQDHYAALPVDRLSAPAYCSCLQIPGHTLPIKIDVCEGNLSEGFVLLNAWSKLGERSRELSRFA